MLGTPKLPTITLDTTLAELYCIAGIKDAHRRLAQVMCPVNSAVQLSADIPRNVKYLYQDGAFNAPLIEDGVNTLGREPKQELAINYIAVVAQRDAFLSGTGAVILFDMGESQEEKAHGRREAERTFSALPEKQRPNLSFYSGPAELPINIQGTDAIACKLVHDCLEDQNLLVPPETLWLINTKEALAKSGLPTPRCSTIEVDGYGGEAHLCCDVCRSDSDSYIIPVACTGQRGKWHAQQSSKIFQALSAHPLPFVFKNQQAYGGAGTYIIRTKKDREELLQTMKHGVLRWLLSSVTNSNKHLRPATILLTDLIEDPIGNYGLCFFAKDCDEEPIFLAVTEQILSEGKAWIGSMIDYSRQDTLQTKFRNLVKDMTSWLCGHKYVGPVGVDVLETATSAQYPQTQLSSFHVLDLNARTSGQLCLPLLRTHFTNRGLNNVSSFFIRVWKTREAFIREFYEDFETGRICMLSRYEDPKSDLSLGNVVIGAEDLGSLEEGMRRIRAVSEEVSF